MRGGWIVFHLSFQHFSPTLYSLGGFFFFRQTMTLFLLFLFFSPQGLYPVRSTENTHTRVWERLFFTRRYLWITRRDKVCVMPQDGK